MRLSYNSMLNKQIFFDTFLNYVDYLLFYPIELDKNSADIAAEGAILNEMLDIVARRAALRPSASFAELTISPKRLRSYNAMDKITTSTSLNEISSIHCNPSTSPTLGYEESNV